MADSVHVVTDRCHQKGYLHTGWTMWLLLFTVRDGAGDDDDNDTGLRQYLHSIRRNYAFLSENDGLEGPASSPFPIGLALRSCLRAARSRRGGQTQLSFE